MTQTIEVWASLLGYRGRYTLSTLGNIVSAKTQRQLRTKSRAWSGYPRAALQQGGNRLDINVHRLVAEVFIPNPNNKPEVNHKDGNRTNNSISNLEWVTTAENNKHSRDVLGNRVDGMHNPNARIQPSAVRAILAAWRSEGLSQRQLAKRFGLSKTHVAYLQRAWRDKNEQC